MFNRSVFSSLMGTGSTAVLLVALTILVMAAPSAFSLSADRLRVKVERVTGVQSGQPFSVGINLENDSGLQIGGFDFLLAYDANLATLIGAQQGQMLNDCAWEYFTYRTGPFDGCNGDCPSGLVRLVAIANLNNGSAVPDCYAESGGELASLEFIATSDSSLHSQWMPVNFYWLDCPDNMIATKTGDTAYFSDEVFLEDWVPAPPPVDTFPNYSGAPEHCLDSSHVGVGRQIDFYGNGAEINFPDTGSTAGHLRVKVEHTYGVHIGQPFSVGISLENDSAMQIGGFDFLLAYDGNLATLTGAQQGQLMTDCEWEYFTYRTVSPDSCNGDCPNGLVRLVALAEILNGPNHPNCFGELGGELASLDFLTTSDTSQHCQWIPVSFFWLDCGDNIVSSRTGDTLYVSENVYTLENLPLPVPPVDTFPNYSGTPAHCLDSSQGSISRRIDFWGNGADIYCADSIDQRGDINLNGIAFEVADHVLFFHYFLYGLDVFVVDPEMQIAASDCNWDGLTLTLPDLVYLGQAVVGDSIPDPSPPAPTWLVDTVVLIQDTIAHTVSVYYADSLTALHLIFAGEVVPSFNLPYHQTGAVFNSAVTRVLASPPPSDILGLPLIDTGLILSYTGDGQLAEAYAAKDGFNSILTVIQGSSAPDCCELRGDINGDGQIDVTDLTYTVDYIFSGGPPPPCMLEANIDGQGALMDVSDLVYLVDFLFRNGPPPVPCP